MKLDLYYVENWSITGDIVILAKTVRAVVAKGTARTRLTPRHGSEHGMTGLIVQEWIERVGRGRAGARRLARRAARFAGRRLWNDDPTRFPPVDRRRVVDGPHAAPRPQGARASHDVRHVAHGLGCGEPDWVLTSSYVFAHHAGFGTRARGSEVLVRAHARPLPVGARPRQPHVGAPRRTARAACLSGVDRRAAASSGSLAANSEFVRDRIRRAWERDARVIHPPVDAAASSTAVPDWAARTTPVERALLESLPDRGFLMAASRLVPYKRHDAVIRMGAALDLPVVVVGSGPERERLEALAADAGVPVHLLGRVSDELMRALFQRALAFVFPPVEDFGIIPVEAMAAGCPVIVEPRRRGGGVRRRRRRRGARTTPTTPRGTAAAIDLRHRHPARGGTRACARLRHRAVRGRRARLGARRARSGRGELPAEQRLLGARVALRTSRRGDATRRSTGLATAA